MPASAKLLHWYASLIAAIVSPRRYCAVRTAASLIRSAGRYHRIAAFALLALRFTYIRILSIAVTYCVTAVFYIACCAVMLLRYPLHCSSTIRRHGSAARFDHRAVTMMICASEGYVIRRRVATYRRSASRLRRAVCAADVLRAIRRATDLSRRSRIAPPPPPAHLARRYATDRGSV